MKNTISLTLGIIALSLVAVSAQSNACERVCANVEISDSLGQNVHETIGAPSVKRTFSKDDLVKSCAAPGVEIERSTIYAR